MVEGCIDQGSVGPSSAIANFFTHFSKWPDPDSMSSGQDVRNVLKANVNFFTVSKSLTQVKDRIRHSLFVSFSSYLDDHEITQRESLKKPSGCEQMEIILALNLLEKKYKKC